MSAAPEAAHAAAMLLTLGAGLAAGLAPPGRLRPPWATLAVAALTAGGFALQSAVPALLPLASRAPALLAGGQLWRAITALFAQDGATGAAFNLTVLLLLGAVAEMQLGPRRWLAVYFGGGVLTEFLALAWQPHGAGNSIACFALAGALTLRPVGGRVAALQLVPRLVALGGGLALLLRHDVHGLGFFAGVVAAALLALAARPWPTAGRTAKKA